MTWSLAWSLGGRSGTVTDIDVAWSESVSMTRAVGNWRSAAIDALLDIDLTTERAHPRMGRAELSWDGKVQIAGRWRGVEWEPTTDGRARVTFDLSDEEDDDHGQWPPVGFQFPRRDPDEVVYYDLVSTPAVRTWDGYTQMGGRLPDTLENVPIISKELYPEVAEPAEGMSWPYPIGKPGRGYTSPACPAYVYETRATGGYFQKLGISGAPVACTTVTVYGPRWSGADPPSGVLDYIENVTVYHDVRDDGSPFAYVKLADLLDPGGGGADKIDNDANSIFWWSAEQEATPAGAGDVLLDVLGASTQRVDFMEWRRVAPRLNGYLFDGYCEAATTPTAFAKAQMFPLLPLSALPGPHGLRPVLWPWLDDTEAIGIHVIDGQGVSFERAVRYLDAQDLGSMRVRFGYDPKKGAAARIATANSQSTVRAVVREAPETDEMEARLVWDRATAQQIAHDAIRWRSWSPRVLEAQVMDRDLYGPGAPCDLYPGRRIVVTDPALGITAQAAIVGEREYDATRALVRIYLLDDDLAAV